MQNDISVVDLFCGIGGLSYGLKKAGLNIKAGFDFDDNCKYTYETNCKAKFIHQDISQVDRNDILKFYDKNNINILVGCAPCQPFSTYTLKYDKTKDTRWQLLYEFARLIKETNPQIISMENVPNLLKFKKEPIFENFITDLKKRNYFVWYDIIYCPDYGIPQKRKRLVLLASKLSEISLIKPTHTPSSYVTVQDAIGNLEPIKSGEYSKNDCNHSALQKKVGMKVA